VVVCVWAARMSSLYEWLGHMQHATQCWASLVNVSPFFFLLGWRSFKVPGTKAACSPWVMWGVVFTACGFSL
jgi:hypothetical protein